METRSGSPEQLERQIVRLEEVPKEFETINDIQFSQAPVLCAQRWDIRKGWIPTVAAVRQSGSSLIIEDFVAPTAKLADM